MIRMPALLLVGSALLPPPASGQEEAPILPPGEFDFGATPLDDTEYEVRWISRPGGPEADTGYVYMEFEDFLSEGRRAVRATWLPFFGDLGNMDLVILDATSYAVRYRLEPRAGGGHGIFWYEEGRAHAAQVDSTGQSGRDEMPLERPVFSVPTLPWVLAQLSGRIDEPVRIELPGFDPEDGGSVSRPLLTPGRRVVRTPPEGGGSYPVREMTVEFDSGATWRYLVGRAPPYFLGITARNAEGAETSRIEVVSWSAPALDPTRRIPQILRQGYIEGN